MNNVVWISDIHLGLVTDGVSRDDEIFDVVDQAIQCAIKHNAYFILGGDVFNKNNPSEDLIARFINRVITPLNSNSIKSYIMVGNHDSIHDENHRSCLSFIKELKEYPYIKLIDDITSISVKDESDIGKTHFTFLPHITKAHTKGEQSPQQYIESHCKARMEKFDNDNHYIFSHLNVKGVAHGSEEKLLRNSSVFLPSCIVSNNTTNSGYPIVIQGHIHTHGVYGNVNVVGSPIFCGYGELEKEKYFLHLEIPSRFNEKLKFNYIKTKCQKFEQIDLDLIGQSVASLDSIKEFKEFKSNLDKNCYVKINVTIDSNCTIDFKLERQNLINQFGCVVKPILPRIVTKRITRDIKQVKELPIEKAIQLFLKNNNPKRMKEKWELSKKYIGAK